MRAIVFHVIFGTQSIHEKCDYDFFALFLCSLENIESAQNGQGSGGICLVLTICQHNF